MASGPELPAIYNGPHGANGAIGSATISLNTALPNSRCKLVGIWLYNTTLRTFTTVPSGWTKVLDQVIGTHRFGLFFTDRADPANTAGVTFGVSGTTAWSANGNDWEGLHADPNQLVANTPVTANFTGAAASLSIPTMTVPVGTMPIWFWCARYTTTAGASGATFTVPADLEPSGNVSGSSSALRATNGIWRTPGVAGDGARGLQHPAGASGAKALAATSTGMSAWTGIGFALRAADQGGRFAAAA
jgi:hypothetical protein